MGDKVAKFRIGEKVKRGKKTLTVTGVYKLQNVLYYLVNESKLSYPEHELEKIEKIK